MLKKSLIIVLSLWVSASFAQAPKVLNITYVKSPFNVQCMAMKERGTLEKALASDGVKVRWIPIKGGVNQIRGMAAGEIDMACAMNTSTLLIANATENTIVAVDGVARPTKAFAIAASTDIKTVQGLKGKTVVGPKGTLAHHMLLAALKKAGLNASDVNFISMNFPASLRALLVGRADAVLVTASGLLTAKKEKMNVLTTADGLMNAHLMLTARADFAKQSPEVVTKVIKANREALRWSQTNKDEALALGAKVHDISIADAKTLYSWMDFYEGISPDIQNDLEDTQAFLLNEGMMRGPVSVESLIWRP